MELNKILDYLNEKDSKTNKFHTIELFSDGSGKIIDTEKETILINFDSLKELEKEIEKENDPLFILKKLINNKEEIDINNLKKLVKIIKNQITLNEITTYLNSLKDKYAQFYIHEDYSGGIESDSSMKEFKNEESLIEIIRQ